MKSEGRLKQCISGAQQLASFLLQELCSCQTVVLSVEDEVGQRIIIEDLLEATRSASDASLRQAAVTILNAYFARTRLDYSAHVRTLLSGLIRLLNDSNPDVLAQSWDTISSITKVCARPLEERALGDPEVVFVLHTIQRKLYSLKHFYLAKSRDMLKCLSITFII